MRAEPYLFFQGRCEEAFAFYGKALGAKVEALVRFGDMPGAAGPPASAGKVMHAVLRIGETVVFCSDGQNTGAAAFNGFALSLSVSSDNEAETVFGALGEGGQVGVPLSPTPFATRFGMVTDRFGVLWNVVHPSAQA